jgi:hypothetical protein
VLTHTRPCPPPGAGALLAVSAVAPLAGAGVAAAGLPAAELFGLNKSLRLALAGEGEATGLAAVAASAFLRMRFALGEAAGETLVEADAAVSDGEAVVWAFLCVRCFGPAGDSPGVGD